MAYIKELHEVTACIYKQGDEKPAMKWSFLTKKKKRIFRHSSLPEIVRFGPKIQGNRSLEIPSEIIVQAVNGGTRISTW